MTALDADDVLWDLSDLLDGRSDEAAVDELLDDADRRADALATQRGQVASWDASALAGFMADQAALHEAIGKAGSWASLRFATDVNDPTRGALMQRVQERATAMSTELLFFELEWAALDDEQADALLADERLGFGRPPPALGAAVPRRTCSPSRRRRILTEKSVTGARPGSGCSTSSPPRSRSSSTAAPPRSSRAWPLGLAPTARPRRRRPPRSPQALRPGPAHPGLHLQHPAARQVHRRPAAQLPDVDLQPATWPTRPPTSRCRRSSTRCRPATTFRSAGTGSRPASSASIGSPTTTAWRLGRRRPRVVLRLRPKDLVLDATASSRRSWPTSPAGSSTSAGSTPRCGRPSGPARSAPTPCRPTTPTCCSTGRRSGATC